MNNRMKRIEVFLHKVGHRGYRTQTTISVKSIKEAIAFCRKAYPSWLMGDIVRIVKSTGKWSDYHIEDKHERTAPWGMCDSIRIVR